MKKLLLAFVLLLLPVTTAAQNMSPSPQSLNAAFSSSCTSMTCATWQLNNNVSATLQVTGTFSGTLTFYGSGDGGQTYLALSVTKLSDGTYGSTTTSGGQFAIVNVGLTHVQVRFSAWTSGGANISATRGYGSGGGGGGGGGAGDASASNQTNGNQKTQIVDGSGNVIGATSNALDVNIKSGAGSGGTALADGGTFTAGSTSATPISGLYEASPSTCTTGKACAVGLTTNREQKVTLTTALPAGTAAIGKLASNTGVTIGAVEIAAAQTLATVTTVGAVTAITNALPAGTNGIGKLTANGGVIIGDVNLNGVTLSSGRVPVLADINNGSTTDGDDGSVAAGQTSLAVTIPLTYLYNGSAWVRPTSDPCQTEAKVYTTISQTTSTELVTGTASKKTYICGVTLVGADAENVSFVAGTGTVCATSIAAVIGGTTAAAGPNLAANGGFVLNNGAFAWAVTETNQDNLCLLQSGSGRVAGVLVTVVR